VQELVNGQTLAFEYFFWWMCQAEQASYVDREEVYNDRCGHLPGSPTALLALNTGIVAFRNR
jgi:hypothetical protein